MNELLQQILNEKKIAFAIFSSDFSLVQHSRYFTRLVDVSDARKECSLFDLFPELIGSESEVEQVFKGKQKRFELNKISKFSENKKLSYYDLLLLPARTGTADQLLCILNDSTLETSLEQKIQQQLHEIKLLESTIVGNYPSYSRGIIGCSPQIEIVRNFISKIAEIRNTTILLEGETGTGKNLVARLIHNNSMLAKSPFIEVNCASIPATLIESEIFGYEKGAFTNATNSKHGLLEEADGGTFFLDEISELPVGLQSKFLSFMETKTFRRLGSTQVKTVHVRIIAATNRHLHQAVERGEFRQDLFFRLNVLGIKLPALRDLQEDMFDIADHFIQLYAFDFKKKALRLSDASKAKLIRYHWPGNVRELRNVIERAVIFSDGEFIEPEHLLLIEEQPMPEDLLSVNAATNRTLSLFEVERELIVQALKQAKNNQTRAAKILGLSLDTLRYRMKKYSINL